MARFRPRVLIALCISAAGAATAFEAAQADSLVASRAAPVSDDAELSRIGAEIVGYGSNPESLSYRFRRVEDARPYSIGLPDGSVYLSRGLLEAVGGEEQKIAFLCAVEADLIADGSTLRNEHVARLLDGLDAASALPAELLGAVDGTLTAERLFRADKTAMLYLARAGIPPMEGVRALDAVARAGAVYTTLTEAPIAGGTLLDRKVKASQAVSELIKGATDFDFAVMDLAEQDYGSAALRFARFLELFPENYAGWNNLGLCHYHQAIVRLSPRMFPLADAIAEWDTSFLTRSTRAIDRDKWNQAKAAYDQAVAIDPSRIEAYSNLGNLYTVDGQTEPAQAAYQQALVINANHAITLNNLGSLLAEQAFQGVPREALTRFAAAAAADPTLPEAQYNLALATAELGEPGAEQAYRRYLALAPNGAQADLARRAVGEGGGRRPGRGGTQPVSDGTQPERWLELWNRVQLALESRDRDLVALLNETPDHQQPAPLRDVSMWGWSRQGLVVELVSGRVNRVVAGRPPGHEAQTQRGVEVGLTTAQVKEKYGLPPAVSRQSPYDIWLYPRTGVGFFVIGEKVNKIFLFQVAEQ